MDADGITFRDNFRECKSGKKNNRKSIDKASKSLCNQRFEGVFQRLDRRYASVNAADLKNNRESINSVWTHSNKGVCDAVLLSNDRFKLEGWT